MVDQIQLWESRNAMSDVPSIRAAFSDAVNEPSSWSDYCFALCDAEKGPDPLELNELEKQLVAVYQLDSCINSSGLFSFFELQPQSAAIALTAMKAVGLDALAQMVADATQAIGIPEQASQTKIAETCRNWLNQPTEDFETLLDRLEVLEEVYYANPMATESAAFLFIKAHQNTLARL